MANEQNLIPNSERSSEEVRENGRKGGIKSRRSKKKKKDFKRRTGILINTGNNNII